MKGSGWTWVLSALLFVSLVSVAAFYAPDAQEAAEEGRAAAKAPAGRAGPIRIEPVGAMTAVVLPVAGSYAKHPAVIEQIITYVGSNYFQMAGTPFGVYYNDPHEVPEDSLRWEVGIPVKGVEEVEAPYELREFPAVETAAVTTCTGPYEGVAGCYEVLMTWIQKNGYVVTGPPMEQWMTDPTTTKPDSLQSRIIVPVTKKE